jgi:hypothetical protein
VFSCAPGKGKIPANPKGSLSDRDSGRRHEFLASRREWFAKTTRTRPVKVNPPRRRAALPARFFL